MSRILLIFDDFTELTTMESNLKKIGFDIIGISNEFSLSQQMLSFNPDLVIVSGNSARVSSTSVGKKLKENTRWTGKTLLIFQNNFRPDSDELPDVRMDFALEYPISFTQLITAMAQLLQTPSTTLLDRWKKVRMSDDQHEEPTSFDPSQVVPEESIFVSGGGADELAEEISNLERREIEKELNSKNWNRELADFEERKKAKKVSFGEMAKQTGFDPQRALNKKETKRRLKKLREEWSEKDLENQDKLRRQFTQALFKKSR